MIRTAVLTALALGALATPALAFETQSAPAPRTNDAPGFTNLGKVFGMAPSGTTEPFRFGPSDQAQTKGSTVVYDLSSGKSADRIDVTDPRDNPFMPQPERRSDRSAQPAH